MNSIKYRFEKISRTSPHWSTYGCYVEAIEGRGYSHKAIRRNFLELVPKEDYCPSEEKALVAYLDSV